MTPSDPRVGEIQALLPDEVWTAMPSLTDDGVIMHRVYDDEGHCVAECSSPEIAEFIAAAPADVAYLLAQLAARDEALGRVEALAVQYDLAEKSLRDRAEGYIEGEYKSRHLDKADDERCHARRLRAAVAATNGGGDRG